MALPDSLAELVRRLRHHADLSDAFGPTDEGNCMRLAAEVVTEMQNMITTQVQHLEAEVRRLERERANYG